MSGDAYTPRGLSERTYLDSVYMAVIHSNQPVNKLVSADFTCYFTEWTSVLPLPRQLKYDQSRVPYTLPDVPILYSSQLF